MPSIFYSTIHYRLYNWKWTIGERVFSPLIRKKGLIQLKQPAKFFLVLFFLPFSTNVFKRSFIKLRLLSFSQTRIDYELCKRISGHSNWEKSVLYYGKQGIHIFVCLPPWKNSIPKSMTRIFHNGKANENKKKRNPLLCTNRII